MRKSALTAIAALAILSGGTLAEAAWADSSADPATRGVAPANAAPMRQAAVVCGSSGCYTPQTKYQPKRKFQPLGHG